MSKYFEPMLSHPKPDTPRWLDRRWRYTVPPPLQPAVRRLLTSHALKTYGPNCHWCGCKTVRPRADWKGNLAMNARTLEHLIARGMGGKDTYENTRIACYACNTSRSLTQMMDVWLHRLGIMAPNKLFGCYIMGDEAV